MKHEVKANLVCAFSFLCTFSPVRIKASDFHFTRVTYTPTILFEMNKTLLQKILILANHLLY